MPEQRLIPPINEDVKIVGTEFSELNSNAMNYALGAKD